MSNSLNLPGFDVKFEKKILNKFDGVDVINIYLIQINHHKAIKAAGDTATIREIV